MHNQIRRFGSMNCGITNVYNLCATKITPSNHRNLFLFRVESLREPRRDAQIGCLIETGASIVLNIYKCKSQLIGDGDMSHINRYEKETLNALR